MKYQTDKIAELQEKLKQIVRDVESGKLNNEEAADKIIEIRTAIEKIIKELRSKS